MPGLRRPGITFTKKMPAAIIAITLASLCQTRFANRLLGPHNGILGTQTLDSFQLNRGYRFASSGCDLLANVYPVLYSITPGDAYNAHPYVYDTLGLTIHSCAFEK